ncbi:MAG: CVNH domain-containing protein [Pseudomonadota bacterium]
MKTGILVALAAAGVSLALAATAWAQSLPLPSGSYRGSCENARAMQVSGGGRLLTAQCRAANGSVRNTSLRFENCRGDIANTNGALTCSQGQTTRPPSGSYQQTCRNAEVRNGTLFASCQDSRGRYQSASINPSSCRGRDIANDNGRLICASNGGGNRPPAGSYQQSCRNAEMRNGILYASCEDNRGRFQNTSIDPDTCRRRDIANNNGRLTCTNAGGGNRPPSGSYQQTCRNAEMRNGTLFASCQDSRGRWQNSSINPDTCRGRDIANNNGRLICATNGGGVRPPSGSYQQTCRNAEMRNGTLFASCQDSRGRWQSSSINPDSCRGRDIANVNGRLTCASNGGGGGAGPIPRGSYQSSCRNASMRGTVLSAQCRLTFGSQTRNTSIDTRTCGGRDIYNLNGVLRCDGRAGG